MAIERVIGVDFGTSTSVMRVKRYENGKPVGSGSRLDVQGISEKSMDHIPTLVQSCGTENRYFGTDAKVPKGRDHEIHSNFKLELESADPEKRTKAQMLTRDFLVYMGKRYKAMKEGSALFEADTERTIVSYPVKWKDETRKFMLDSATAAGFPNVEGMDEAEAAIHAAIIQHEDMLREKGYLKEGMPAVILLIDMGAGTTDMVLCRYVPGKQPQKQVLATWPEQGDVLFGGAEVDSLLRLYAKGLFLSEEDSEDCLKRISLDQFKEWKEGNVSPELRENRSVNYFQKLMEKAEDRDIELKPFSLDRQSFESLAEGYLRQFPELLTGCLKKAGITGSQVDLVILTGGHSQWYFVKEILAGKMPHICPALLPQISHDLSRVIQMAEPQATAALGMVYSPMTANLSRNDKQEQPRQETPRQEPQNSAYSQLFTKSSTVSTKSQISVVDYYAEHFNELICCGWVVKPDGSCININSAVDSKHLQGVRIKRLCEHFYGYVFGITEEGRIVNVSGLAIDLEKYNKFNQMSFNHWNDIAYIDSRCEHTVGLRNNGTVVAVGRNNKGQCNVGHWSNIIQIACGSAQTAGLRGDGTVVTTFKDDRVSKWRDITAICYCMGWLFGLTKDGTILSNVDFAEDKYKVIEKMAEKMLGGGVYNTYPCCLLKNGTVWGPDLKLSPKFNSIISVARGFDSVAGLRMDGTLVAEGKNDVGQCNVSSWTDVIAIAANPHYNRIYGLRKDGRVYYTSYKKEQGLFKEKIIPDPKGTLTQFSIF